MCFSATASFVGGTFVAGLGVATLPLVRDPRERWFAALPVIFGVHQMIEGTIWQRIEQAGSASMHSVPVLLWLLIAWFLLPIWVPLSVRAMEPDPARRRWMLGLAGVGLLIGTFLYVSAVRFSTDVVVNAHHLEYQLPLHPGWVLGVPYVAATCLPMLLSSNSFVNRFGVLMVVSMGISTLIAARQFSSVWCFFAALMSVTIFVHYLLARRAHEAGSVALP